MHSDETRIYIALLITATILAIILTFFVISLIRQHKKNLQLHKEKIQAEVNTLENERKRIASDLHDDIGPVLSAVKLQINSLDTKDSQDLILLDRAGKHIDDILTKVREIANNLMPGVLSRKGLPAAIKEFADNINYLREISIDCTFSVNEPTLEKEREIHLYRIVQEIIHNSIKHSSASRISLALSEAKGKLVLNIKDNGIGFDYSKTLREHTGFGLKNILNRVDILEGSIYLDTQEGKGVDYTIEIPLINNQV